MSDVAQPGEVAVSVLLPVRDGQAHLADAIHSVLDQTLRALELIVIDDGSSDDSARVAAEIGRADDRLRLLRRDPAGIPAALNAGLAVARGHWVARMDADDLSLPERFERLLAASRDRPDVVGWASWARAMAPTGQKANLMARGPVTDEEFRRQHCAGRVDVTAATVMLDRGRVIEVGGYDARLVVGEDIELYDRLGACGPILTVPEVLYLVRIHPDSTWARELDFGQTVERFLVARRDAAGVGRTLDFDEYLAAERRAPWWQRARWRRWSYVRGLQQRAIVDRLAGRTSRAVVRFALVGLLAPRLLLTVARRQLANRRLG